ncbi:Permease of the drug/metabolite transporter (DMT) superfamily [Salinihabitans flavidus]|uniref:Permease of the drug/metabolite transporter (DMT) superfamily n=1 Tax=Salinihabitans flavidus TaxID=569882 RepID=A0A1H8L8B6_9RHOB|nr:DMT family transporter [Salinihabitans flavidus]SEO00958.1 Permease of the drug/metabolite transporter (DMT) superfamily [Salinihabitans flavidus]
MTRETLAHLAMLLMSASVAGSFSLGALAANEISPVALTAVRFWLAAGVIAGAAMATTGLPRKAARAPWRYLLLGGLFSIYFVLMFEGLKTARPVSTSAVFTLTPVLAAGFGYLLLRQRMTRRIALALAIGAVGALWVIFRADFAAFLRFEVGRGEAIFFVGCVAHAFYIPLVRRLNRGEPAIVFTFGTIVAGALVLTLVGWGELRATEWTALPGIVWIALAYLVVFATALSFVCVQFASLHLPAAKVMAYTYLIPSWVTLWEIALGHGAPGPLVFAGIGLTVVALVLLLKNEDRPASHRETHSPETARTHRG